MATRRHILIAPPAKSKTVRTFYTGCRRSGAPGTLHLSSGLSQNGAARPICLEIAMDRACRQLLPPMYSGTHPNSLSRYSGGKQTSQPTIAARPHPQTDSAPLRCPKTPPAPRGQRDQRARVLEFARNRADRSTGHTADTEAKRVVSSGPFDSGARSEFTMGRTDPESWAVGTRARASWCT